MSPSQIGVSHCCNCTRPLRFSCSPRQNSSSNDECPGGDCSTQAPVTVHTKEAPASSCRRNFAWNAAGFAGEERRSEEHTSELQSQSNLVCRLLLEKKKKKRV